MYNEQKKYVVEKIEKNRKDANKADRKAFWQTFGADACLAIIGVSAVLANVQTPVISHELATGIHFLSGIAGTTFLIEAIHNNSKANLANDHADALEEQLDLAEIAEKNVKTR